MAKLVALQIKCFRSIENLNLTFDLNQKIVCLIGRGDSGKSTILEAISSVLSPAWNLAFHDTDFFKCDYKNPIEIQASLIDLPNKLLSEDKFGLYVRALNTNTNEIIDDLVAEEDSSCVPLLTLKLRVDEHLEPKWSVINLRDQEEKSISSSERALLNCYMVADYLDRHFSWNKGNPLYSLLQTTDVQNIQEERNVIIQSLRSAKTKIDEYAFGELTEVTNIVTAQAAALGLNILNASTTLDFKELAIKDGKISLHDDSIPFRLKGKGSKRLTSLAIQLSLVSDGGIMLVDEIEQGLEPDRIKNLIRSLKEINRGQIFLTTHSREVITELGAEHLRLLIKDYDNCKIEDRKLKNDNKWLNDVVRACPEAFFAKKIIVCEGATEVGICRAFDKFRKHTGKPFMSFSDCAYIDGTGSTLLDRASSIALVNIDVALLCDSDDLNTNNKKPDLQSKGIQIFDCQDSNCIEQQIFNDLPWNGIRELIQYALIVHKKNDKKALEESIKSKFPPGVHPKDEWLEVDTIELRSALGKASVTNGKEWFKRIDHGEFLGDVIFKCFDEMKDEIRLKNIFTLLSKWIDA